MHKDAKPKSLGARSDKIVVVTHTKNIETLNKLKILRRSIRRRIKKFVEHTCKKMLKVFAKDQN
ncbi:hypothetical protein CCR75_009785 [Bremia lactucae]|uniref:Uncharacterized protein n=1 Tax=Bremia lactucae TaxID=4779 RepID=A0A976FDI7_BRELC|nr:hypothetical protein CCR75_009785 [Bremia lactucae]